MIRLLPLQGISHGLVNLLMRPNSVWQSKRRAAEIANQTGRPC